MVSPIVIGGPTASGKSAFAMQLAKEVGGELICADSRQFYEGMRIGTAGPTQKACDAVVHHLYHAFSLQEEIDAGRFVQLADETVRHIQERGKVPILVGGTGLYLRAFRFGMQDVPKKDPSIRLRLEQEADEKGLLFLYKRLQVLDPYTAEKVSPHDLVRIVRALEIWELTGTPPSILRQTHCYQAPRLEARWLLVWPEKEWHRQQIVHRAQAMWAEGLLEETAQLRTILPKEHRLLQTIGYAEAGLVLDGKLTLEQAFLLLKQRHLAYAKRQKTWFKKENWWALVDAMAHVGVLQ